MKPVETSASNARLILPEEEGLPDDKRRGDLPIERCMFIDPETEEQKPGFESTWLPEPGERRAIANGAPVMVRLWGLQHPPIKVEVGDPDEESKEALVSVDVVLKASSGFFDALSKRIADGEEIEPEEIHEMFRRELRLQMREGRPPGGSTNGNGPGH